MPPAEVLANSPYPSRSNSTFLRPTHHQQQQQPSASSATHRKRSITMTTASAVSQQSKLAAALAAPENGGSRSRRNSITTESSTTTTSTSSTSTRKRLSNMMRRRPSQSTSASSSSSGSSSDKKSTSSNISRRQSLTRATASSLAKVVPSFHNKTTNAEPPKPSSQHNGTINILLARRRNSMMALSNATQPSTPKPSGSTVAKSTSYSKLGANNTGANGNGGANNSSKWFGLRRPSSPAIPSPSSSSTQPSPRQRRYSMIPTSTVTSTTTQVKSNHYNHMARQQHQHQHDKHDSKLATLAKQQQQRTNTAHQETETPVGSISNSWSLKPKNNVPARPDVGTNTIVKSAVPVPASSSSGATAATAPAAPPADKAATAIVGAPSVAAACAEHSAAQQDSYFEQHHPTETPRTITTTTAAASTVTKAPSETCSRLSSRMLDSDISISSIDSRRSSVSSLRTVQSACHHNTTTKTTQHPAWLASAGFMRRTKCTACNPNSHHTEHRRSLSRSSSMYDVAATAAAQQQPQVSTLRRLSRTSLTEDNGNIKTNINRRIASADGTIDPPLTPIPNTTVAFIRQQQQQQQQLYGNNRSTMPTAAATCAAAMAAAAAVVSAAAATAATTNPDSTNEKWIRLIGNCITHSNKLERLAHDLITSEQQATHMLETHESMEDAQKSRDQQYQIQVKECEALVRVQREMLVEMENLLSEHGYNRKQIDTTPQQLQHDLTTPPPSSPSASSSSSIPSLPHRDQQQQQQQQTTKSSSSLQDEEEDGDDEDSQQEEHSPGQEQEQCAERSGHDQKQQAESSEAKQEQHSRQLTESPEPYQEELEQEQQQQQQEEEEVEKEDESDKPWSEIVEDTVSQIRWNVSQWVGGGVGTGQIVKCEMGPDGLMSTIIVAGTGVTTEPRLLPKHLMQHRPDKSVYYHQYILYIEREDRKRRFTLMPSAQWVQDDQVNCCQFSYTGDSSSHIQCESEFDWLARRHHCRRCGHIFCNTHSSNRLPLFDAQNAKAEWSRVCDGCFYDLAGSSLFHPSEDR